jgi:membrane-associated protease RseP (regulator of RpoE activity)
MVRQWLRVVIGGLVVSVALGAGAAVAVLAASSDGPSPPPPASPGGLLPEAEEGHSWLGILATDAGDEGGVLVQQVFVDSPAHEAGLERGDIIAAFDDRQVTNTPRLKAALAERQAGEQVSLVVLRDDEEITIKVTLGERPEPLWPREPKGPFAELGEIEFGDILSGEVTVANEEGNAVTINMVPGEVMDISDDELKVALNEGGERTFKLTDDTVIARERLEEGSPVVVLTVGDSDEARIVIGGRMLEMLGTLSMLRERLRDIPRFEMPKLHPPCRTDIPRLFEVLERELLPLPPGIRFEFEVSPDEAATH